MPDLFNILLLNFGMHYQGVWKEGRTSNFFKRKTKTWIVYLVIKFGHSKHYLHLQYCCVWIYFVYPVVHFGEQLIYQCGMSSIAGYLRHTKYGFIHSMERQRQALHDDSLKQNTPFLINIAVSRTCLSVPLLYLSTDENNLYV